jgi:type IV secretory pathway VirB9-like protein
MEYGHDPLREYVIYAKWGGLTPVSLTPGSRIGGVSIADPEGWRIDDRQSYGSGRTATPVLTLSPGSGSRATTAVVTTQAADGLFMLKLVPHKTGFSQVKFRKPAPAPASRVLAQGPDTSRAGASYRLRGDRVAWQPLSVRDDGTRTFVELRPGIEALGVPAVMAIGPDKESRPVNARKQRNTLVVDGIHPHGLRLSLGDETIEARRL